MALNELKVKEATPTESDLDLPRIGVKLSEDWDPDHSTFLSCIPLAQADGIFLFGGLVGQTVAYFATLQTITQEYGHRNDIFFLSLCCVVVIEVLGGLVFFSVWNHLGKKLLYYKMLKRAVLLDYDNTAWYKSPMMWLLGAVTLSVGVFVVNGVKYNFVLPLVSAMFGVLMTYKGLLETEKSLIPLNYFFEDGVDFQASITFLSKLKVVRDTDLKRFLKMQGATRMPYDAIAARFRADPTGKTPPLEPQQADHVLMCLLAFLDLPYIVFTTRHAKVAYLASAFMCLVGFCYGLLLLLASKEI